MKDNVVRLMDTRFIFATNFSGDPSRDKFGSDARKCNVVIPDQELALSLRAEGYNVKETKPRPGEELGFVPTYYVIAYLSYHDDPGEEWRNPKVYLVSGDTKPQLLNSHNVGAIDKAYVKRVRTDLNKAVNKKTGRKSFYVRMMYVELDVDEDPYAQFYTTAVSNDEEALPFD